MSAKLMKALAEKSCVLRNNRSGQVRIYWVSDSTKKPEYVDVDGNSSINMLAHASASELRKSATLKKLVHDGILAVV